MADTGVKGRVGRKQAQQAHSENQPRLSSTDIKDIGGNPARDTNLGKRRIKSVYST